MSIAVRARTRNKNYFKCLMKETVEASTHARSAVSSSHAAEGSFLVIVAITILGVQMIILKQERRAMLSAVFVAINKR